jgi:hypothetical protein
VHQRDGRSLVGGIVEPLEHHKVILGNLVKIILPKKALRIKEVTERIKVHQELEDAERKLLVDVERGFSFKISLILGIFDKGLIGLPEDSVAVDSAPVDIGGLAVAAEVIVVGQSHNEDILRYATDGIEVLFAREKFVLSLIHKDTGELCKMDQCGQLDSSQIIETGNLMFVILLDNVEFDGVGLGSIERLKDFGAEEMTT